MSISLRGIIFLFISFFVVPIHAATYCSETHVSEIENYLNNFKKVVIPFRQVSVKNVDERPASGVMLIEKPLKFRINYDRPHPLVIVGGKNFVSIYDFDLQELSRVDAADNLFKFLLELDVKLQKSVKIEQCSLNDEKIELQVMHKETKQQAKISFTKNPILLKEMHIPDGDDVTKNGVKILFDNPIFVKSFNKNLFILKDINVYGAPKRYSSEEILKLTHQVVNF